MRVFQRRYVLRCGLAQVAAAVVAGLATRHACKGIRTSHILNLCCMNKAHSLGVLRPLPASTEKVPLNLIEVILAQGS